MKIKKETNYNLTLNEEEYTALKVVFGRLPYNEFEELYGNALGCDSTIKCKISFGDWKNTYDVLCEAQ